MAEDIAVWKEESTAELLIQINASPFGQSTKVLVQWNFSQKKSVVQTQIRRITYQSIASHVQIT